MYVFLKNIRNTKEHKRFRTYEKIERCGHVGISIDSKVQIAGSISVSDE
jgi:hypothetical protein